MRRITIAAVSLLLSLGLAVTTGGPGSVQAGDCRIVNGTRSCI